ncbi:MAG: hypothetical protein LLF97_03385 [Planctomycetaceae bacterium]|nr:hypothetical protein [Planctomycetaceae bacterium]
MANLPWLDEVLRRLAEHHLPATYVQRFTEELSDHLEDFQEDLMDAKSDVVSRLGNPATVAQAAVASYRQRSFLGRHPTASLLVFGVLPIVWTTILGLLSCFLITIAIAGTDDLLQQLVLGDKTSPPGTFTLTAIRWLFGVVSVMIPTALVSMVHCRLVERLALGRKWMVVCCFVLAILAVLPYWCVRVKTGPQGDYSLLVGVGVSISGPFSGWHFSFSVLQVVQLLVPLAVGGWFWWRTRAASGCAPYTTADGVQ